MIIARRKLKFYPAIFLRPGLMLACVLFSTVTTLAKTPAEYGKNIAEARSSVEALIQLDFKALPAGDYLKAERETLAKIRARVPVSEKIEWQNGAIETDNHWLAGKLDQFEREPRGSTKRLEILKEIGERLDALERKVKELENPLAARRSKDEEKRRLAEILQREEYQKPEEKQPGLIERIIERIIKWLDEMFPRSQVPAQQSNDSGYGSIAFILQMLLYALILGAIGFLIYRFAPIFSIKNRSKKEKAKEARVVLGERLADDETARDLFTEAERLAAAGNLRGAIRKGYIAFLCELSDRKIIGLSRHKTNRDYLRDVRPKETLHRNLSNLTDNYERHWYGFEAAGENDWQEFKYKYKRAISE